MLRPTIRASPTAMAQLSSTTADRHIRDQAQTPVANYCFSSSKKEQAPASRLRRLARTVADPTAQMDDHREPRSAVGGLLPSWPRHSGRRDSFGHGPAPGSRSIRRVRPGGARRPAGAAALTRRDSETAGPGSVAQDVTRGGTRFLEELGEASRVFRSARRLLK
jgi:hypothetical protein